MLTVLSLLHCVSHEPACNRLCASNWATCLIIYTLFIPTVWMKPENITESERRTVLDTWDFFF